MTDAEFRDAYVRLGHAIQTGVAYQHQYDPSDGSHKHLRTGINVLFCELSGLVETLKASGAIREEDYRENVLAALRKEVASYEALLSERYALKVTLG